MSRKPARAERPAQFRPEASRRARAELEFEEATILGARRPYELSIEVREERKDPDSKLFLDQGPDDSLSQKRLDEVRLMLNQSRESSQEFDVENPF